MRRDRTFSALPLAVAALVLGMGMSGANAQSQNQAGEVCVQQNGVYLANVRIKIFESHGRVVRGYEKKGVVIGAMYCAPFKYIDDRVLITVDAVLGQAKQCQFTLFGRTGQQTVTSSGTTLNVGLACP
ncbi:hypothetical protein [Azospirillum sp.]|uniref:hypothetical protein n=1 Tax=Azospirillum sp. TaxID=34012 RepID=UPI002D2411C6|nr:hypothetical protein [Azospirillum sp.]HYD67721.1 hypothetical protein [Azospirillum sp.]